MTSRVEIEPAAGTPTSSAAPFTNFARVWAIVALAHIFGNRPSPELDPQWVELRVSFAVLGAAAIWLFFQPSNRRALAATALLCVVTYWFEAPFTGNHWLLAALVSAAILVALTRPDPWAWFAPTGRWILLVFYGFAGFAKLNSGFLDPVTSCAVTYTNQALDAAFLPTVSPTSALAAWLAVAVVVIELSVPALLIIRRTRYAGVLLAASFHFVISLDLNQHFYDFTSVLFALFLLFLADNSVPVASRWGNGDRGRAILAGVFAALVYLSVTPQGGGVAGVVRDTAFLLWVPFGLWYLHVAWKRGRPVGPGSLHVPRSVPAILLVAVVVVNGLTPYLELKTATSWNMYANLQTVGGETNHVLIRRTLPLTGGSDDLVEIVATSDEGLAQYVDSGYLVPRANVANYLDSQGEAQVTIRYQGDTRTLTAAELGGRQSLLRQKFALLRAVDANDPVRCQTSFLPAR